jgi:hypothetical protein
MRKEDEMTTKKMNPEALFELAKFMKPFYDIHQVLYMEYVEEPDDIYKEDRWMRSVEEYHEAIKKLAPRLGKAMGIGRAQTVMLLGVRGSMIIWTPEWLRNVANYERINPNYWVHPQARKLNNYEFPKEISS